jgi:hypothetical protein
MVNEIIIPKNNLAQVEEVRELENKQQEQTNQPTITESVKETVVPTTHASYELSEGDKEGKEKFDKVGGAVIVGGVLLSIPVGEKIASSMEATGGVESAIGKATGIEGLEVMGDTHKGMAENSVTNAAKKVGEAGKKIKELFK